VAEKFLGKLIPESKHDTGKDAVKTWTFFKTLRIPLIFGLATAAWVPFRSESLEKMAMVWDALIHQHAGITHFELPILTFSALGIFLLLDLLQYNQQPNEWLGKQHFALRWTIYAILIFGTLAFAAVEEVPFIYFQF
jgi:hypothetical protein